MAGACGALDRRSAAVPHPLQCPHHRLAPLDVHPVEVIGALGVEVSRASILARREMGEGASKEERKKLLSLEKLLAERPA